MPVELIVAILFFLTVIAVMITFYTLSEHEDPILLISWIPTALLGLWLLASYNQPLVVEKTTQYQVSEVQKTNGIMSQIIYDNDKVVNLNDYFHGYLTNKKIIVATYYKKWYLGIWYPNDCKTNYEVLSIKVEK